MKHPIKRKFLFAWLQEKYHVRVLERYQLSDQEVIHFDLVT